MGEPKVNGAADIELQLRGKSLGIRQPRWARHTFGHRLRAARVGLEDRQDLLGHKRQEITTHYSAAEVGELLASANRVLEARAPSSTTLLRIVASIPVRRGRGSQRFAQTGSDTDRAGLVQ